MNNKMAINTYISTTESEKQTKQNKYRGRSTEAEHFDDCQMGGQGMGERWEGIKKYKLVVTEQSWGGKYSIRNRVAREHICRTHRNGQWCEDCLRECQSWVEGGKGGKTGTTVIA